MSAEFLDAVLGADRPGLELELPSWWPDDHDRRFLELRRRQLEREPSREEWARALVLRGEKRLVGHAGFHGPPGTNALTAEDAVELGYTVFPDFRGRGYATEAARALISWAEAEHGIRRFVASVAPGNDPSLALVRRLGFEETGRHWDDEDGEELEFQLLLGGSTGKAAS